MNMGYECISPQEDLDNCGGCVSLGQGVSCEKVAGVKKTECSRGRCVIRKSLWFKKNTLFAELGSMFFFLTGPFVFFFCRHLSFWLGFG